MTDKTWVLQGEGEFSFEEKRSKFLGCCRPVATEDEARQVLAAVKAAHRTASHHVYAYALTENTRVRYSDDGEPSGTAGMPVLNVFQKQAVTDFICVVTRYFGGTLLGTGGLSRAYTKAAQGAMAAAGLIERIEMKTYGVVCDYGRLESLKYTCARLGVSIISVDYGVRCEAVLHVPAYAETAFLQSGFDGRLLTLAD